MKRAAVCTLLLASCSASASLPADANERLDPIKFFTGRSAGDATLRKLVGDPVRVLVNSRGSADGKGGLILDQRIREGTKPPRQRRWIMQPAGPGRFSGSLSDAIGPVDVRVDGPRAIIHYRMKGGLEVDQQLALQAGGQTLLNHFTVHKLGVRVAVLDEVIRKLD